MTDTTPNGLHPAHPTAAQLQAEAATDRLVAAQCAAAERLAEILSVAVAQIRTIDFPLGAPAQGYDPDDILALLRDMTPDLRVMIPRWRDAAAARVGESV